MNDTSVARIASGTAATVSRGSRVLVGYDGRADSERFADIVVAVLVEAGMEVGLLDRPLPTPVLAHAAAEELAEVALMITASHNPATDNGVKVFGPGGRQLDPAHEHAVESAVAAAPPAQFGPPGRVGPADEQPVGQTVDRIGERSTRAYVAAVAPVGSRRRGGTAPGQLAEGGGRPIVYTPLHGVAWPVLRDAFEAAGRRPPEVVAGQADPDGAFPTVASPNPEDPEALAALLDLAERRGADLALANDPDGDRLAVAAATPGGGRPLPLTGDEIGALLAEHLLGRVLGAGAPADRHLVVSTTASSCLVAAIAAWHGAVHVTTPTGFKWIMAAVAARPDLTFAFGYEEALGFAVTDAVPDKDGVSAALAVASMHEHLAEAGATLWDELDRLACRHGLHLSRSVACPVPGGPGGARRGRPVPRLAAGDEVDGMSVVEVAAAPEAPELTVVELAHPEGDARVGVRRSGTETKVKAYAQVVVEGYGRTGAGGGSRYLAARHRWDDRLRALAGGVLASLDAG